MHMNPQDIINAQVEAVANLRDELLAEVKVAIASGDVANAWDPGLIDKIAIADQATAGLCRAQLRQAFGADLAPREWNKALADARSRLTRPVRNGASSHEGEWQQHLIRNDGGTKMLPCYQNVALYLENHSDWDGVLGYNELTAGYEILRPPPAPITAEAGTEIEDIFDTEATRWLEINGLFIKPQAVRQVVDSIAKKNAYHPVRDYLNALPKWDGNLRIGSWLIDYCGVDSGDANPNAYASAVGEKFLVSAIARVMEPGCKADHLLILEGEQGIGKSSAARILASDGWFTDQIAELGSKDSMMQLRGVWIVELSELGAFGRSDTERLKAFFSAQVERFRVPYGRRVVQVPRQCVFIGTTNSDSWLKDETGGRRFWPVKCTEIDLAGLARDRDQLWAEALVRYRDGERWYLDSAELVRDAKAEQSQRYQGDVWQEDVMVAAKELFEFRGSASVREIMAKIGIETSRRDPIASNRVARCLRVAGWPRTKGRLSEAKEWRYEPPDGPQEL